MLKKKTPDLNKKKKNENYFRSEKVLKTMSKLGIFDRKDQPLQVGKALLQ